MPTKDPKKPGPRSTAEAARVFNRIRELIAKGYTSRQIGEMTGKSQQVIDQYKSGRRRGPQRRAYGVYIPTIKELQLRKVECRCPRCEEKVYLITVSGMCVQCHLTDMAKQGLITIEVVQLSLKDKVNGSLPPPRQSS